MRLFTYILTVMTISTAVAQSPEQRTRRALDLVLAGKYETLYASFSPEMKKAISLATYTAQAGQIMTALGKPQSQDPPRTQHAGDSVTVTIPVHWAQTTLNFIVSWNAAGEIQGTWFRRPEAAQAAAPYQAPAYIQPSTFSSRDVTFGAAEWKLPGTLVFPSGQGPFPAVVLVHGSGPNDRDESVGGVRVFRDLAEGLASRGIAVLRYDKRTRVYPQKCAIDPDFNMSRETVDDAVLAAAFLRTQPGIDPRRVFVLGHSQGGYMMPRIMRADPALAGVIVMAGSVRPLQEIVVEQTEYIFRLKGDLTAAQQSQLAAIRQNPWSILPGITQKYKEDLKDYDPVALAADSSIPMLILQGERDYQVRMTDFDLWKTGLARKQNVTLRSFPKLNHLFVTGEGKSTPQEYDRPGHVAPEVIEAILPFLAVSAPAAIVLKPVANMYAQPTEDAEVVSQALYATSVTVLEERPGWLHIRTADEYTGWLPAADAHRSTATEKVYASAGRVAQIDSLFANIYHEPNVTRRRPLIAVPYETRLEVIAEPGDEPRWLEVRLPDDRAGWLQRGDVTFDAQPLSIDAAIELSRRFLGLPYTWGGASSFGYDCSGFTQMLCRRRGVVMPRDADVQAAWQGATPVRREELKPGDLLFFGSAPGHITHTGMYIGEGKFINATTWIHPVIQICDVGDPHWTRLLVACRRVK